MLLKLSQEAPACFRMLLVARGQLPSRQSPCRNLQVRAEGEQFLRASPRKAGPGPLSAPAVLRSVSDIVWRPAAQSQAKACNAPRVTATVSGAPIWGHFYGLPFSTALERQAK